MTNFAYELNKKSKSYVSDCDLSTKQYYAVKMNATEEIVLASTAGETMLGVLQDAPAAAGRTCEVAGTGTTSKAIGGAAIVAGANVQVGTGGKFVTLTSGAMAGIAVTACGDDEEQFSLDIIIGV